MIPHAPAREAKYAFQPYVCTILARGTPALAAPAGATPDAQEGSTLDSRSCCSTAVPRHEQEWERLHNNVILAEMLLPQHGPKH